MKTIIIFILILILGFTQKDTSTLKFLFHGIPLNNDKYVINNYLKDNSQFFPITSDSLFIKDGFRLVKTRTNKQLKNIADSSTIELTHTWQETVNAFGSLHLYNLNAITLTTYFKTQLLRDQEFDSLQSVLTKKYKLISDQDNKIQREYSLSRKTYPKIVLTKDMLSTVRPYFTLRYYAVDNYTSH